MRNVSQPLSLVAAAAAGALFMYFVDSVSGARRRSLARDKLGAAGREAAQHVRLQGKHAVDRLKGAVSNRRMGEPQNDEQLHERIRSRLGHVLSHPRSLHVEIDRGHVCLKGDVLTSELDSVLSEVNGMAGVKSLRSELTGHETAETLPHAPAHPISPRETQEHAHDAWNEQGL